ncbi:MAG: hypothetical protein ACSHXW_08985 [Yoonia sp.]
MIATPPPVQHFSSQRAKAGAAHCLTAYGGFRSNPICHNVHLHQTRASKMILIWIGFGDKTGHCIDVKKQFIAGYGQSRQMGHAVKTHSPTTLDPSCDAQTSESQRL